jgi:hypothetical protein
MLSLQASIPSGHCGMRRIAGQSGLIERKENQLITSDCGRFER